MNFGLFGPRIKFVEMFEAQAANLLKVSDILHRIYVTDNPLLIDPLWAKDVIEVESDGDKLAADIHKKIKTVNILPQPFLDRDDVTELADRLDNVLDHVEEAVKKLLNYRVAGDPALNEMILVVRESIALIPEGIRCLRNITNDDLENLIEKIREREHRADRLEDKMINGSYEINVVGITGKNSGDVFTQADAQKVEDAKNFKRMRRELAEIFERAVDACRDIFKTLTNIKLSA